MEDPSDQKNFKTEGSQQRHFNPTTSTKVKTKPPTTTMPVPTNKYNKMIEMYNNIRNLINRPNVDIRGLRNLLSKLQGEEEQNLHPITKDITERIIYYVIEVNYDDDEEVCNDKMDMLAENLDKVTNVMRSGSYNKESDINEIWIEQGKLSEHEPDFDNLVDITRLITTATINLLFNTTRAGLHPHWISSEEEEEEEYNQYSEDQVSEEDNEANNLYLPD